MTQQQLARGLGWFSIGLGMTQLLAPKWLGRKIGIGERTGLLRLLGARETLTGVVALMDDRPVTPMWGRVAGDLMDLGLLAAALRSPWNERSRVAAATAAVVGVGVVDLLCARSLQAA